MEEKKQILIVEDERIIAKDIQVKLEYLGFSVTDIVGSGEEAIEISASKKPDLILMDINLEGEIDGIEAAAIIHKSNIIPVIYLTSYSDDATLQRAKITNPLGYINKPFNEKELHTSIELAFYKYDIDLKLQESEKKYRSLFENAQVGIVRFSIQNNEILEVNSKFIEIFGYKNRKTVLGKKMSDFFYFSKEYRQIKAKISELGFLNQYELRMKKADGSLIWIDGSSWTREKELVIESVLMDISEKKQIEEKLIQSQKMETVGQIAAGIAHEINTPLAVVSTRLEILHDDIEKYHPESVKQINIINKNIYRISNIIEKLLGFSRFPQDQKSLININSLLQEVLLFVNTKSRKMGIEIKLNLLSDLPSINYYQNKLEQVFLNVLMNAIDAMPTGGKITISTSIMTRADSHSEIEIKFIDDGVGMDEISRERIFDPFYTTKPSGKGTGLGMYISYGIIKELNGEILVKSNKNQGTEIRIILPLEEE